MWQTHYSIACIFENSYNVAVMRILSFLYTSSDFVQVWVPEPLVYVVSLNVTSTQRDAL